jgi:hypothetical protein
MTKRKNMYGIEYEWTTKWGITTWWEKTHD